MTSKSKNEAFRKGVGIQTRHVFSENGEVFIRTAQLVHQEEWSPINFHWKPVLQLERDLM
ncbi:MAG: hypothetical protein AAF090_15905 [Bacteroidota bacterium]